MNSSIQSKMFLTTAIAYPNGPPHLGHLYESVVADFIKRVSLVCGTPVFLQTGTDEHGKKMENAAKALSVTPKTLSERNSSLFRSLYDRIETSYDSFFRTSTHPEHAPLVQRILRELVAKNEVYLSTYRGWYSSREESFYTEREAASHDFKDPGTGKPLEEVEEPAYFFRMEPYRERIIEFLKTDVIRPTNALEGMLKRLEEPLLDLCVSRTGVTWGIPFPEGGEHHDGDHRVYVWFDALLNYVSGRPKDMDLDERGVHIIGCDILWFHAVIYPAILMASGLEKHLPRKILVHGFVTDSRGYKMSKSVGNVVAPEEALELPGLRYYLLSSAPFGGNVAYSPGAMKESYQGELVSNLGNLAQRTMGMCRKMGWSTLPEDKKIPSDEWAPQVYREFFESYDPRSYAREVMAQSKSLNKKFQELISRRNGVDQDNLRYFLTHLRALFRVAIPLAPKECERVLEMFSPGATVQSFKVFS